MTRPARELPGGLEVARVGPWDSHTTNAKVSASSNAPPTGVTGNLIWVGRESGISVWNARHFGSNTIVQAPCACGMSHNEYLPAGIARPASVIGLFVSSVVA